MSAALSRRIRDDSGSAVAEFSLVAGLLTVLTLSVIQLGLALLVRNTVLDAAAEGARTAALADTTRADGAERTRQLITTAIGEGYAGDIDVSYETWNGQPCAEVTVTTTLPIIGLVGIEHGLEVSGHAVRETLD
ncbi:TadE/TadG family type IV pilus assembly protein [Paramicrobacterium agarici]|uniref:TadE-like protein n=1 Tax=Paramicrobacterium agarici TaxID=630514 RepID=A0A2A9DY40_9MICO|nr:TadE/TadG family type IV pilus assembly protein [Microbacterium agarici]PFG31598.1 TadE-like protein [Microbacterium agarici]TQO21515.1 TadE-like protein [Microbacterium agarici]